jgi:antitoxin (DNA-binding transcriptional repressor) of toxin-antitoxin stability system
MAISIKDLRYRSRQVLQSLKRGEKPVITYRGHPIARIIPLSAADKRTFREVGFGMWKSRSDLKDVNQWLDNQRKPRFGR